MTGATGAQGPVGPAGSVETIEMARCTTVRAKHGNQQRCTAKLVSESAKLAGTGKTATALLMRGHTVYATGTARTGGAMIALRMTPVRTMGSGAYTLVLLWGTGRHQVSWSETATISGS